MRDAFKRSPVNALDQPDRIHQRYIGGFTYIGLLIMVAIIGVATAASLQVGSIVQRRAAEEELLEIGLEFRNALTSYANAAPPRDIGKAPGTYRMPSSLDDLLRDPAYPNTRRHLRKLYVDPMTGADAWGTMLSPDGKGIVGIYSLSQARPIKIGNFDSRFQDFDGAMSYQGWKFTAAQATLTPSK